MSDYRVSSSEDESRLSSAIGALKEKEAEMPTEIESDEAYYYGGSSFNCQSSEDESGLSSAIGALEEKEAEMPTEIESDEAYDYLPSEERDTEMPTEFESDEAYYHGISSFNYLSSEDESGLSSALRALRKTKAEVRTEIEQRDDYYDESRVVLAETESYPAVQQLSSAIGALNEKEGEIRLGLRSRGGHRGKVDNKVLVWLEEFENIKNHVSGLTKQPSLG